MTGPLRIETVTRATAREAAATLADAFADDPVMAYLVPRGNHRRRRRGFYLGEILAALGPGAVVELARDTHGAAVGVAVWTSPRPPVSARLRFVAHAWRFALALGPGGLRRVRECAAATGPHELTVPHWSLDDIGVLPRARGCGVGSALLMHRLTRIDHRAEPVALSSTTPGSRRLYERHGFHMVAEVSVGPVRSAAVMIRHAS